MVNDTSRLAIHIQVKNVIGFVNKAIEEDTKKNYEKAVELYKEGIQMLFGILRSKI